MFHFFVLFFSLQCVNLFQDKTIFKKSALAKKNKKSKRWLVGLVVSRSDIISKNVRFISVNLMLALSP